MAEIKNNLQLGTTTSSLHPRLSAVSQGSYVNKLRVYDATIPRGSSVAYNVEDKTVRTLRSKRKIKRKETTPKAIDLQPVRTTQSTKSAPSTAVWLRSPPVKTRDVKQPFADVATSEALKSMDGKLEEEERAEELERNIGMLNQKIETYRELISSLEMENSAIRSQLHTLGAGAEEENIRLLRQIEEVSEESVRLREEKEALMETSDIEALNADLRQHKTLLSQAHAKKAKAKSDAAFIHTQLVSAESHVASLTARELRFTEELAEKTREQIALEKEFQESRLSSHGLLESLRSEFSARDLEVNKLRSELSVSKTEAESVKDLGKEIENSKHLIGKEEEKATERLAEMNDLLTKNASLKKENENVEIRLSKSEIALRNLRESSQETESKLQMDLKKTKNDKWKIEQRVRTLQQELADMQKESEEHLKETLAENEQQRRKGKKAYEQLRTLRVDQSAEVSSLKAQLEKANERLKLRELSFLESTNDLQADVTEKTIKWRAELDDQTIAFRRCEDLTRVEHEQEIATLRKLCSSSEEKQTEENALAVRQAKLETAKSWKEEMNGLVEKMEAKDRQSAALQQKLKLEQDRMEESFKFKLDETNSRMLAMLVATSEEIQVIRREKERSDEMVNTLKLEEAEQEKKHCEDEEQSAVASAALRAHLSKAREECEELELKMYLERENAESAMKALSCRLASENTDGKEQDELHMERMIEEHKKEMRELQDELRRKEKMVKSTKLEKESLTAQFEEKLKERDATFAEALDDEREKAKNPSVQEKTIADMRAEMVPMKTRQEVFPGLKKDTSAMMKNDDEWKSEGGSTGKENRESDAGSDEQDENVKVVEALRSELKAREDDVKDLRRTVDSLQEIKMEELSDMGSDMPKNEGEKVGPNRRSTLSGGIPKGNSSGPAEARLEINKVKTEKNRLEQKLRSTSQLTADMKQQHKIAVERLEDQTEQKSRKDAKEMDVLRLQKVGLSTETLSLKGQVSKLQAKLRSLDTKQSDTEVEYQEKLRAQSEAHAMELVARDQETSSEVYNEKEKLLKVKTELIEETCASKMQLQASEAHHSMKYAMQGQELTQAHALELSELGKEKELMKHGYQCELRELHAEHEALREELEKAHASHEKVVREYEGERVKMVQERKFLFEEFDDSMQGYQHPQYGYLNIREKTVVHSPPPPPSWSSPPCNSVIPPVCAPTVVVGDTNGNDEVEGKVAPELMARKTSSCHSLPSRVDEEKLGKNGTASAGTKKSGMLEEEDNNAAVLRENKIPLFNRMEEEEKQRSSEGIESIGRTLGKRIRTLVAENRELQSRADEAEQCYKGIKDTNVDLRRTTEVLRSEIALMMKEKETKEEVVRSEIAHMMEEKEAKEEMQRTVHAVNEDTLNRKMHALREQMKDDAHTFRSETSDKIRALEAEKKNLEQHGEMLEHDFGRLTEVQASEVSRLQAALANEEQRHEEAAEGVRVKVANLEDKTHALDRELQDMKDAEYKLMCKNIRREKQLGVAKSRLQGLLQDEWHQTQVLQDYLQLSNDFGAQQQDNIVKTTALREAEAALKVEERERAGTMKRIEELHSELEEVNKKAQKSSTRSEESIALLEAKVEEASRLHKEEAEAIRKRLKRAKDEAVEEVQKKLEDSRQETDRHKEELCRKRLAMQETHHLHEEKKKAAEREIEELRMRLHASIACHEANEEKLHQAHRELNFKRAIEHDLRQDIEHKNDLIKLRDDAVTAMKESFKREVEELKGHKRDKQKQGQDQEQQRYPSVLSDAQTVVHQQQHQQQQQVQQPFRTTSAPHGAKSIQQHHQQEQEQQPVRTTSPSHGSAQEVAHQQQHHQPVRKTSPPRGSDASNDDGYPLSIPSYPSTPNNRSIDNNSFEDLQLRTIKNIVDDGEGDRSSGEGVVRVQEHSSSPDGYKKGGFPHESLERMRGQADLTLAPPTHQQQQPAMENENNRSAPPVAHTQEEATEKAHTTTAALLPEEGENVEENVEDHQEPQHLPHEDGNDVVIVEAHGTHGVPKGESSVVGDAVDNNILLGIVGDAVDTHSVVDDAVDNNILLGASFPAISLTQEGIAEERSHDMTLKKKAGLSSEAPSEWVKGDDHDHHKVKDRPLHDKPRTTMKSAPAVSERNEGGGGEGGGVSDSGTPKSKPKMSSYPESPRLEGSWLTTLNESLGYNQSVQDINSPSSHHPHPTTPQKQQPHHHPHHDQLYHSSPPAMGRTSKDTISTRASESSHITFDGTCQDHYHTHHDGSTPTSTNTITNPHPHHSNGDDIIQLFRHAEELSEQKQFQAAVTTFDRVLSLYESTSNRNTMNNRESTGNSTDVNQSSEYVYGGILYGENSTFAAEVWAHKGVALQSLGHVEDAIEAYAEGTRLDPTMHVCFANLASLAAYLGKWNMAKEMITEALKMEPHNEVYFDILRQCAEKPNIYE